MTIKRIHTAKEARENIKLGMWCSNCCREEVEQIKTQENIDDWIKYLEQDEDVLTIADTYEEIWEVME